MDTWWSEWHNATKYAFYLLHVLYSFLMVGRTTTICFQHGRFLKAFGTLKIFAITIPQFKTLISIRSCIENKPGTSIMLLQFLVIEYMYFNVCIMIVVQKLLELEFFCIIVNLVNVLKILKSDLTTQIRSNTNTNTFIRLFACISIRSFNKYMHNNQIIEQINIVPNVSMTTLHFEYNVTRK